MDPTIENGFRLSPQQARLWSYPREGDPCELKARAVIHIQGPLDPELLGRTLAGMVARHEILRTTFQMLAGMSVPLQVIGPAYCLRLAPIPLKDEPLAHGSRDLFARAADAHASLETGPMLRALLFSRNEDSSFLVLELPALCCDERGLYNLFEELARGYFEPAANADAGTADGTMQYADLAEWMHDLLESAEMESGSLFWRNQNLSDLAAIDLPFGLGPTEAKREPSSCEVVPSPAITERIAATYGADPRQVGDFLLTCWTILLGRLSESAKVLIGIGVDGRQQPELAGLPGFFAKFLPQRFAAEESRSFREVLKGLATARAQAETWQDYFSWDQVSLGPHPENQDGTTPALPFAFDCLQLPSQRIQSSPRFTLLESEVGGERFHLHLRVRLGPEAEPRLSLVFDANRLCHEAAAILARQLETLIEDAVAHPERRVGALETLSPEERRMVLTTFQPGDAGESSRLPAQHGFERWAARAGARVALVDCSGQAHVTYAELDARANRLAHLLTENGARSDMLVALYLERSLDMVTAMLAVWKAGAGYLPLDPNDPHERVNLILEQASVRLLITRSRLPRRLAPAAAHAILLESGRAIEEKPGNPPSLNPLPDHLAYAVFTSGSTGRPKGCLVSHRNVANYLAWLRTEVLGETPRHFPLFTSAGFDFSVTSLHGALGGGGGLSIFAEKIGVESILAECFGTRGRVDAIKLTPSHVSILQQMEPAPNNINLVLSGGEELSARHVAVLKRASPAMRLVNHYGPSEATVGCIAGEVEHETGPIPIGRPIAGMAAFILDRRGRPVSIGVRGELFLAGAGLARGYRRNGAHSAERFVPHPFSNGQRLYRSGDAARWLPDGRIQYLGRLDFQVKIRGYRVEPGEIEAALARFPQVGACLVMAGERSGYKKLIAYVTPAGRDRPDEREMREFLSRRLPEYMVPATFMVLGQLPLTPHGKVDRRALPHAEGSRRISQSYVSPRNPAEERLARIWRETLGVDRVGIYDNFFSLGGDSILIIQIVSRAQREGLQLIPKQLYGNPTVAALAAVAQSSGASPPKREVPAGPVPFSHAQARFAEKDPPDPHHFNQSVMLSVSTDLEAGRLQALLEQIVARHDALNFRFHRDNGRWSQEWRGALEHALKFERVDLSPLSPSERTRQVQELVTTFQSGLNLERGPLIRAGLFRMGSGQQDRLLFVIHHLVIDGISWRIFLEELEMGYQQVFRGESPVLPETTASFREWAIRLQDFAQSKRITGQLAYWCNRPRVENLPTDISDTTSNTIGDAVPLTSSLSREATADLIQRVPAAYRTQINDVLLTALVLACHDWSGEPRLLVDMEGHGREEILEDLDLTRTLGWFTSVFPVFLELASADVGAALKSVKEQLRAVPDRGIGFGLLRYLNPDKRIQAATRALQPAEVLFNYLGRTDRVFSNANRWRQAEEPTGPDYDSRTPRDHLLELNCIVDQDRLRITWTYNHRRFRRETIQNLDQSFRRALAAIIEHCRFSRGFTPSDFPLARFSQAELDQLIEVLETTGAPKGMGEPEDIYPLSPMQAGMLFHALFERQTQTYFEQVTCMIEGPLHLNAFTRAWDRVVARHAVLRTSFHWQGLAKPVQVVAPAAQIPWRMWDWREFDPEGREERWRRLLERDRAEGFSFSQAPLMRCHLVTLAENRFRFCLSYHHILLDGWSSAILFKEVFRAYQAPHEGRPPTEESAPPYSNYIAWQQGQNPAETEAYWRATFAGFQEPIRLGAGPTETGVGTRRPEGRPVTGSYREIYLELPRRLTGELDQMVRARGLTLNTCIHGAWAVLLGHHGATADVVYGATVSGRPPSLEGVEGMVGLFINTLPVRVDLDKGDVLAQWLHGLQQAQAERDPHTHAALTDIQGWSEVPRGTPLFETILVFENYPIDPSVDQGAETLAVQRVQVIQHSNYPLTVSIKPGVRLSLEFGYDSLHIAESLITRMRDQLETVLKHMIHDPDRHLSELKEILTDGDRDHRKTKEYALKTANIHHLKRAGRKALRGH